MKLIELLESVRAYSNPKFSRDWISRDFENILKEAKKRKCKYIIVNTADIQKKVENLSQEKANAIYNTAFKTFIKGFRKVDINTLKNQFQDLYKNDANFKRTVDKASKKGGEVWIGETRNISITPSKFNVRQMQIGAQGNDEDFLKQVKNKGITTEALKKTFKNDLTKIPRALYNRMIRTDTFNNLIPDKKIRNQLHKKYRTKDLPKNRSLQ